VQNFATFASAVPKI